MWGGGGGSGVWGGGLWLGGGGGFGGVGGVCGGWGWGGGGGVGGVMGCCGGVCIFLVGDFLVCWGGCRCVGGRGVLGGLGGV